MPFPDRKHFQRLAQSTQFQVDVLEKAYRLISLLEKIISHPTFGGMLLLRGGTALNFLYLDLPRLSVDIDLDFVGVIRKEEMEEVRPRFDEALKRIFKADGYKVRPIESYALTQYFLSYTSTIPQSDMVKVEINYLNRMPTLGVEEVEFNAIQFGIEESFKVNTLKFEELLASKAVTFLARNYPIDLYDLYRLNSLKGKVDLNLAHKLVIFLGCIEEENFLDFTPEVVERISFDEFKRGLIPLLRKSERINLDQVKVETKYLLTLLLERDDSVNAFLKKFYKGEFAPQLLFESYEINPEIKEHPGAKWRLKNLSEEQRKRFLSKLSS
jgi:hypothetical protein